MQRDTKEPNKVTTCTRLPYLTRTPAAMAQAGIALAESVYKIGSSAQGVQGDIGEGIKKLSEFLKDVESRRDEVARSVLSDLIVPMKASIDNEAREAANFERNYKKRQGGYANRNSKA